MQTSWINFLVGLATTFVAVGVSYGICISKISALEEVALRVQSDHDVLVRISEKIDVIQRDVKEIKSDVKKHLER